MLPTNLLNRCSSMLVYNGRKKLLQQLLSDCPFCEQQKMRPNQDTITEINCTQKCQKDWGAYWQEKNTGKEQLVTKFNNTYYYNAVVDALNDAYFYNNGKLGTIRQLR